MPQTLITIEGHPPIRRREFIVLIAAMMAIAAMAIDTMLPALGLMGASYFIPQEEANRTQWVIYAFMIGLAIAQLVYGPAADRWGRKPIGLMGAIIFCGATLGVIYAPTFEFLLIMRAVQGVGMAAMRILAATVVRDLFKGEDMSRLMGMVMMVFIFVPILAPSIGQGLISLWHWHSIFWFLLAYCTLMMVWYQRRMPETLRPEWRRDFTVSSIYDSLKLCLKERNTVGYASISGVMYGALVAYLGSVSQIFQYDVYGLHEHFSLLFGGIAFAMVWAYRLNGRHVKRLGTRTMTRRALIGFAIFSALMLAASLLWHGRPPLPVFVGLLIGALFCFSINLPNANAIAMEPLHALAGSASSWLGAYTSIVGAILGSLIGQQFNGTVTPFATGYCILAALALLIWYWTEQPRLATPASTPA